MADIFEFTYMQINEANFRWILIYLLIINITSFVLYGADKWQAVHDGWRVRESTLIGIAVIGGTIGGMLAMHTFRHKTQKPRFRLGLPIILILQIVLILIL